MCPNPPFTKLAMLGPITLQFCQRPPVRGRYRKTGSLDNKEAYSFLFRKLSGGFLLTWSFIKGANQHFFTPEETAPSHSSSIQFAVLLTLGEPASLCPPREPAVPAGYFLYSGMSFSSKGPFGKHVLLSLTIPPLISSSLGVASDSLNLLLLWSLVFWYFL